MCNLLSALEMVGCIKTSLQSQEGNPAQYAQ